MLLVEVLSHVAPELGVGNMARCESLMVSYQNRPAVGKCLFWALGQAGVRNFSVGVKSNNIIICFLEQICNYYYYYLFIASV